MAENEIKITDAQFVLNTDDNVKLHITYDEDLQLSVLSETLELINKAVNDLNRENGASNTSISRDYSSKVSSVESGSIVLNIVIYVISPLTIGLLSNAIYDRLKLLKKKRKKDASDEQRYPISVTGNKNEIHIHIYNRVEE